MSPAPSVLRKGVTPSIVQTPQQNARPAAMASVEPSGETAIACRPTLRRLSSIGMVKRTTGRGGSRRRRFQQPRRRGGGGRNRESDEADDRHRYTGRASRRDGVLDTW